MEMKTAFLICWILLPILATATAKPQMCNVVSLIQFANNSMKNLLMEYIKENNITENTPIWPEEFKELDLKSVSHSEKLNRSRCGLHYLLQTVKMIEEHQKRHHPKKFIFIQLKTVHVRLTDANYCVGRHIGGCTNKPEPDFTLELTHEKRRWGYTVLQLSHDFLDELKNVVIQCSILKKGCA